MISTSLRITEEGYRAVIFSWIFRWKRAENRESADS